MELVYHLKTVIGIIEHLFFLITISLKIVWMKLVYSSIGWINNKIGKQGEQVTLTGTNVSNVILT